MTITLKYFGSLADITKLREEQFTFDEETISVSALKSKVEGSYQNIQNTTYTIAVNQTMSDSQTKIKDQDVIAFLPPFAGG
ncbi:MoaD/ThiS family protein [Flavobacterium aquicola]|uniref:Molybdopterin synthase sulfur carrier subunit n=1 Tax=Flavobacterium aquicola TaxID=1682742 RepID=A0A3E0EK36_9FLAO|nr:MoaD/ThiS family protein [Flavobacterium aquicola]REG98612.1 molybdopterin synthase subunit MoaD [Flavobacterium aquicola]